MLGMTQPFPSQDSVTLIPRDPVCRSEVRFILPPCSQSFPFTLLRGLGCGEHRAGLGPWCHGTPCLPGRVPTEQSSHSSVSWRGCHRVVLKLFDIYPRRVLSYTFVFLTVFTSGHVKTKQVCSPWMRAPPLFVCS